MKRAAKILIISTVLILIASALALANIVFLSPGYHKAFGMHSFNLSGEAFVFSADNDEFIESTSYSIKTVQPTSGEMRKKCVFKIEGYLDFDVLDEQLPEEDRERGIFYGFIAWCGAFGERSLRYWVVKYDFTGSVEHSFPIDIDPTAQLTFDENEKVYVVGLYYSDSYELRYNVVLGVNDENEAKEYMSGRKH